MPEMVCVPSENRRGPPIGAACPKATAKANGDGEQDTEATWIGKRMAGQVPESRDRWKALPGHARYFAPVGVGSAWGPNGSGSGPSGGC